jgi:hypothetical protein
LWIQSKTQWISCGLELIGLNYEAVEKEAGRNEIKMNRAMWKKIKALEAYELNRQSQPKKERNDNRGSSNKRSIRSKEKLR